MRARDAPERFHCDVFRCAWVAHHAQDPPEDSALMLAKEQLERIEIALPEPIQYVL
jgi:hypothetical protein